MSVDVETLALARKYVRDTAAGLGAVKGAPTTIKTINPVDGGNEIVFEWFGTDGTVKTSSLIVKDGKSPIIKADTNNTDKVYKLVITNADGSEIVTPNLIGSGNSESGGGGNIVVNGNQISSGDTLEFEEISETDIQKLFEESSED